MWGKAQGGLPDHVWLAREAGTEESELWKLDRLLLLGALLPTEISRSEA